MTAEPTEEERAALRAAIRSVSRRGPRSCAIDGCQHFAGYQDSAGEELCACHWGDGLAEECAGQPDPLPPHEEREIEAILAAGFRL